MPYRQSNYHGLGKEAGKQAGDAIGAGTLLNAFIRDYNDRIQHLLQDVASKPDGVAYIIGYGEGLQERTPEAAVKRSIEAQLVHLRNEHARLLAPQPAPQALPQPPQAPAPPPPPPPQPQPGRPLPPPHHNVVSIGRVPKARKKGLTGSTGRLLLGMLHRAPPQPQAEERDGQREEQAQEREGARRRRRGEVEEPPEQEQPRRRRRPPRGRNEDEGGVYEEDRRAA